MIIFFSEGRFGNQIFQYAFLKTIQQHNEKIIVFGFREIKNVFENVEVINLSCKDRIIKYVLKPILRFLCRINLISSISVTFENINVMGHNYNRETTSFVLNKGLFPIRYVIKGFYQSEYFFNRKLIENLRIKNVFIEQARLFLNITPDNNEKIFVHIRRGDYRKYFVYGKETLLPISYFHNQIKQFIEKDNKIYFIFISDEPDFIETEFSYVENKLISINTYEVDFAIMTMCNNAIISPSSFSWWGSFFMKDKGIVYAPKYWLGFNSKLDYPQNILASYMSEIDINLN